MARGLLTGYALGDGFLGSTWYMVFATMWGSFSGPFRGQEAKRPDMA